MKTYGSSPDNTLDADEAGDRFGHSLAVGDFNGDAIPDLDADGHDNLIVTAPKALIDNTPSGQVFIYRSPNTTHLCPPPKNLHPLVPLRPIPLVVRPHRRLGPEESGSTVCNLVFGHSDRGRRVHLADLFN